MNNRQGNRRRGRNNNRSQQGRGGYDHQNRVDNRARGNAAQMLDKYKKLATDSQMNGDRVQAEYYFQFAEHYYRVQADFKARQEEQQAEKSRRQPDRQSDRHSNQDGSQNDDRNRGRNDSDDGRDDNRDNSPENDKRDADDNEKHDAGESKKPVRQRKPRAPARPRKSDSDGDDEKSNGEKSNGQVATIDNDVLPPSLNISSEDDKPAKPARKPRARRPRKTEDNEQADAAE